MSKHSNNSRKVSDTGKKSGDFFGKLFDVTGNSKATSLDFFIIHQVMNSAQNDHENDEWRIFADEGDNYGIPRLIMPRKKNIWMQWMKP